MKMKSHERVFFFFFLLCFTLFFSSFHSSILILIESERLNGRVGLRTRVRRGERSERKGKGKGNEKKKERKGKCYATIFRIDFFGGFLMLV